MTRRPNAFLIPALVLGLAAGGTARAQDLDAGAEGFAVFCADCHGEDATGDGPMATILVKAPPDLTGLARRNGGLFPRGAVVFRIDGRDRLAAHGGEMPIFGGLFDGTVVALKDQSGQPILTSQPIADLIAWLEAIQE